MSHSNEPKIVVCLMCGKEFAMKSFSQKYCSKECCQSAQSEDPVKRYIRERKRKGTYMRDQMSAAQIAKEARLVGLSYGQYVAKMGL